MSPAAVAEEFIAKVGPPKGQCQCCLLPEFHKEVIQELAKRGQTPSRVELYLKDKGFAVSIWSIKNHMGMHVKREGTIA